MDIVGKLKALFGVGEPILLDEIRTALSGYSSSYVFQCIRKAVSEKKLIRYAESVYYLPEQSTFVQPSLNVGKVIEKKYIKENGRTIGFYSGVALLNAIGGTRQMPFVYEVVTNNECTRKREIRLGKSRYILRKARCKITDDNKIILQILELCNKYLWDREAAAAVSNYAKANGITAKDILEYSKYYPAKAIRNASEVLYGIA